MSRFAIGLLCVSLVGACASIGPAPTSSAIDTRVQAAMASTGARGLAIAIIDQGRVSYVQAYGVRNAKGDPLQTDTVMYGASLTKTVMAYTSLALVDQKRIGLDTPIADDLEKPLPSYDPQAMAPDRYGPYNDLAGDDRRRAITPRMALTHSIGFANFWFVEPDQTLRIHSQPGSQFSYSGEGFALLQFVIENGKASQGLGADVGALTNAIFGRLDMKRTSLVWRADFRPNLADGFNDKGEAVEHDERSKVRVAGSMDTTIDDFAKFVAALVRGDGLSPAARAEMVKPSLKITTAHQFPNFGPILPPAQQRKDLAAGLGVIVFDGPQGHGFYKGGHDGQTANLMVCIESSQRCVLILSNDVRAEARFADLDTFVLGDTGAPLDWEYGDNAGRS